MRWLNGESDRNERTIEKMKILVTGSAGFIGYHLCELLLKEGHEVFGVDAFTPYYDVQLKQDRHTRLNRLNGFNSERLHLEDAEALTRIFSSFAPEVVIHLAAQAGVRYSIDNPEVYVSSNLVGTCNLLEQVKKNEIQHFLFASTSSVYGASTEMPFEEADPSNSPMSFYAATKKAGEVMSHSYAHLFDIPTTCFRFFTVYGPWGRPDMALFKFTRAILDSLPIDVFNHGEMHRDFTYVDDLVQAILRLVTAPPGLEDLKIKNDSKSQSAPWRVVNIGNSKSESLLRFIEVLEGELGEKAKKNFLPLQAGDVPKTWADCSLLTELTGFKPSTPIETGIRNFVHWYRQYYENLDR